ncbi:MAG: IS630 family transposase [Hydrogenophaga sp.]|nr:IS630 family transposase [Hydrogenophaga sp.]MDP2094212.1 IS630 family transposase [Hydrogenophaga sp.]
MEAHPPQHKKKRDDAAFEHCREELQALRDQAQAGAIELVYFDESGFAQVHPNRSAWTPCGEQHCIEAPRGQRLNVMAALFSSGKVVHTRYWLSSTAEVFLGFVSELAKNVGKPVVIVLDNASIHRAAAIQPALKLLQKSGVTLKFLPPYSPELNRIEVMWRLMKHRWLALKRRSKEELEQAVDHVFANFGGKFKMEF